MSKKRNKKDRKRKRKEENVKGMTNNHHVLAKSRGGKNLNNLVEWDILFHRKWHELFDTLTVSEIHEFIEIVTQPGTCWTSHSLARLRNKLRNRGSNVVS